MSAYLKSIALLVCAGSTLVWGVDSGRLWLPKQYQAAMPKLQEVANLAENSQRCVDVIHGKLQLSKTTDQDYYFVITCRDKNQRTFNLSFKSPVNSGTPRLVAEQRSGAAAAVVPPDAADSGINSQQAGELCRKEFPAAVDALDEVSLMVDAIAEVQAVDDGFLLSLPFTSQSDLGQRVSYVAECRVSSQGETHFSIVLQRDGALTICKDHLRSEAILIGRSSMADEDVVDMEEEQGFRFHIPFRVKTLEVDGINYLADCRVSRSGDSEISLALQPSGAFRICQRALKIETLLMKGVSMADQPVSERHQGQQFLFEMAFDANSPDGNPRKFRAECRVDEEGEASVKTELDKSAITSVCIHGVREHAKSMIGVTVLEQEVGALQQDGDGYFAEIPFDASDPNGRLLHYLGECRVDETGRTQVRLKPRFLPSSGVEAR